MGGAEELHWIEENNDYINGVLKRFNTENSVIYIGDQDIDSNVVKIHHVMREKDDVVSRYPILNNIELFSALNRCEVMGREENRKRFEDKQKRNSGLLHKIKRKAVENLLNIVGKEYIHSEQYYIPNK